MQTNADAARVVADTARLDQIEGMAPIVGRIVGRYYVALVDSGVPVDEAAPLAGAVHDAIWSKALSVRSLAFPDGWPGSGGDDGA